MAINEIWVAPNGSNSGAGTKASPYKTIQHAINAAEPGTVIKVKAGTYRENIEINRGVNGELRNLTQTNDLKIVSADGPGAAVITGADTSGKVSTITTTAMSHVTIDGFHIVGNVYNANDGGAIKVIGNPDGPNRSPSHDIEIINNTFSGRGVSMIKVTMTEDVRIEDNSFRGSASLNFIDMVTVWSSEIVSNDFTGTARVGITMKAGSQDNLVQQNFFDFTTAGGGMGQTAVLVGGVGHSRLNRDPLPDEFSGFEAKDVSVVNNVITSHTESGVMFQGGVESLVKGNLLGASGGIGVKSSYAPSKGNESSSGDNAIVENTLLNVKKLHGYVEGQADGTMVARNAEGTLQDVGFDYGVDSNSLELVEPAAAQPRSASGIVAEAASAPETAPEVAPITPPDGQTTIKLKVGGTGTDLFPPKFKVIVDGKLVASETIDDPLESDGGRSYVSFNTRDDSLFEIFEYDIADSKLNQIAIVFANDGTSQGVNRDLVVDYVEVDGNKLEAEQHGNFDANNGNALFEGAREKLFVNGTLSFDELAF